MRRSLVESPNIATLGWSHNILEVQFYNGKIFECTNVTKSEFDNLIHSSSLDLALSRLGKNHSYHRVV